MASVEPVVCPACGVDCPSSAPLCPRCGAPLDARRGRWTPVRRPDEPDPLHRAEATCPHPDCGASLSDRAADSCPYCGRSIAAEQPHNEAAAPDVGLLRLPTELADDYDIVEPLPARGAEADLLVVRDRDGVELVVKLYRPGIPIDLELLERLQHANHDHVVTIHDFGTTREDRGYEVLEYVRGGDLEGLRDPEGTPLPHDVVTEIVDELNQAIAHMHELNAPHHDLKPSNILVRTRDPLDLVLVDFGFATLTDASIVLGARRPDMLRYTAPEALGNVGGPPRDLWALGVIVWELLTGRSAFGDVTIDVVAAALVNDPWPLDADVVDDERWNDLLHGLLFRDWQQRWTSDEVSRWLAGERPPVPVLGWSRSGEADQPYRLGGEQHRDATSLARGLSRNWEEGRRRLEDESVLRWLDTWQLDQDAASYLRGVDEEPWDRDGRLLRLILRLDPTTHPVYRGYDASIEGLADLTAAALRGGSSSDEFQTVNSIWREGVLEAIGDLTGRIEYREIAETWHTQVGGFAEHLRRARANGAAVPQELGDGPRVRLLHAIVDSRHGAELRRLATGNAFQRSWSGLVRRLQRVRLPNWYLHIQRNASGVGDYLALRVLYDEANRIVTEGRERRRLDRAAERTDAISVHEAAGGPRSVLVRGLWFPLALALAMSAYLWPVPTLIATGALFGGLLWIPRGIDQLRPAGITNRRLPAPGPGLLLIRAMRRAVGDAFCLTFGLLCAAVAAWMIGYAANETGTFPAVAEMPSRIAAGLFAFGLVAWLRGGDGSDRRSTARAGLDSLRAAPVAISLMVWVGAGFFAHHTYSNPPPTEWLVFPEYPIVDRPTTDVAPTAPARPTPPLVEGSCWLSELAEGSPAGMMARAEELFGQGFPVGSVPTNGTDVLYLAHADATTSRLFAALLDAPEPAALDDCSPYLTYRIPDPPTDGNVWRVSGVDGLHVRTGPGLDFPSATIVGPAVDLASTGRTHENDGITWREVRVPDGAVGWSSGRYLAPSN